MKKFLSVMLIVLLALCVFVSCEDDDEDSSTTSYFTLNSKSYSTLQEVVDAALGGKGTPVSSSTNVIGLTGDYTGPGAIISGLTGYSIDFGDYKFNFTSDIVIKGETEISIIGKLESSKSSVGIVLEDSTVTIDGSSEINSNIKITGATLDVNDSATLSVDYFEVYGSKVKFNTTGETEIAKIYAPTGTNEIEVTGSGKFEIEKNEGSVSYDVINSGTNTNVTIPSADGTTQIEVTTGSISSYSNGVKEENVENIEAAIGATGYETLFDAVNAAGENETIKLFKNLTSTDEALVFEKSGVVLDLNGKTLSLTRTGSTKNIQINSDVTIKNGTINATLTSDSNSAIYGLAGAKLTLEKVNITAKDGNNNMAYAVALLASGTEASPVSLTIDGGTFDGFVGTNGQYRYQNITIEDGTFNGDVYFPGYGAYVINGGTFNSLVEIESGTLEITGGNFNNKADTSFTENNNGTTMTGVSLGAVAYAGTIDGKGYGPTPEITINGGTFEGVIGLASQNEKGTLPLLEVKNVTVKTTIFVDSEASLSSAIDAAKDGDTIKLFDDVTLSNALDLSTRGSVTIDLNEKTLKGRTNLKQGSFTFTNGTIDGNKGQALNVYGSTDSTATNYTVLTIKKDVTINNFSHGICLFGNTAGTNGYDAVVNFKGKLINGVDDCTGIFVSGNLGNKSYDENLISSNIININEDAVISTLDQAIAMNGAATVNVSGGNIKGSEAVGLKRGTLNVTGGTFEAIGEFVDPSIANTNGTEATGAAISITSTYNKSGYIVANVSGASIKSTNGYSFYVGCSNNDSQILAFTNGVNLTYSNNTCTHAEEKGEIGYSNTLTGNVVVNDVIVSPVAE